MNYRKAAATDAEEVCRLVQNTIRTVYPKYYPAEVADFFRVLHNKEKIHEQITTGKSSVLVYEVMEKCFEELG